jgi:two-component system phosphate regulon sensor histidine kinase PhoR
VHLKASDFARLSEQQVPEDIGAGAGISRYSAPGLFAAFFSGLILGGVMFRWLVRRRVNRVRHVAAVQMDVVASVSHELRSSISSIMSAAENVRDGLVQGEECLREQGSIIANQAERLMAVADHVMLYAAASHRTPDDDLHEVNVPEVIEDALRCVSFLLENEKFTVRTEIEPEMPRVAGNLSMLSQCLQNFIVNAVKYSGKSRWIGISAQVSQASRVRPKEIQISVRDQGLGIDQVDREHIFEPYYRGPSSATPSIRGAGLGLSIAKHEAETCGGSISFASEEGIGSVFTLHLPLRGEPADRPLRAP